MSKVAICMADGCEEIEGLTVVDVLRRGGMDIDTVSISGDPYVTGSHNIAFCADKLISELNWADYDGIVLPGGIPGTPNLAASPAVTDALKLFDAEGKLIAAICAAPSVLGQIGLLEGRDATSYPGFAGLQLQDRCRCAGWQYHHQPRHGNSDRICTSHRRIFFRP